MGVSRFGPAQPNNLDKSERPFPEGAQWAGPNDAPLELPLVAESSARLPRMALEHAGIGKKAAEPFDVRSPPQFHPTVDRGVIHGVVEEPVDGTSNVEGSQGLDVDDFRRWWRQSWNQETAGKHYRGPKLTRMAIALGGIALVSSALALKEGAQTLLRGPPAAPRAKAAAAARPAVMSSAFAEYFIGQALSSVRSARFLNYKSSNLIPSGTTKFVHNRSY